MKLKRILSLALSGVMAISMLTACGGGSGIFGSRGQSATFAQLLNKEQDMLDFGSNDGSLNRAVSAVVRSVSEDEKNVNGPDTGDIAAAVRVQTGYSDMWLNGAWSVVEESSHSVKVFIYDATTYTLNEVASKVAEAIDEIAIDEKAAKDDGTYTNTYEGDVAAYSVTIPAAESGADDTELWVVAIAIEQTATKSST